MARARNIKPGFFKNEVLGVADPLYSLLFEGLWVLADRDGRLEDRPLRIKAEVFPYRDGIDTEAMLNWLQEKEFIVRYTSGGKQYIQVINFAKHQSPHKNEIESSIPAPELIGTKPDNIGSTRPDCFNLIPDSNNTSGAVAPLFSEDDLNTANSILADILSLNPNHKPPNINAWAKTIRIMRERDKRPLQEIQALWRWAHAHSFWRTNILSPDKLRQQWDKLAIQRDHGGKNETKQRPMSVKEFPRD